jgi:hypothetical protein
MLGVVKLQVPKVEVQPQFFHVTVQRNNIQRRFFRVALSLSEAITNEYCNGGNYTLAEYVCHSSISVGEINLKFKNYNP